MKNFLYSFIFAIVALTAIGCSGEEYKKTPVDELVQKYQSKKSFSVVLEDMDVDGYISKDYKHKYKILYEENNALKVDSTDWKMVTEEFFVANENNLGMELVSKDTTGKLHKEPTPLGYGNYVGNGSYGHWVNRDGGSFWEWYGKYALISSAFRLFSGGYNRSYYDDYYYHYRGARPYYGPSYSGRSVFGTYGSGTQATRPSNFSDKLSRIKTSATSFKDKVSSKVSRSSGRTSSSSSRGRSGGFGK